MSCRAQVNGDPERSAVQHCSLVLPAQCWVSPVLTSLTAPGQLTIDAAGRKSKSYPGVKIGELHLFETNTHAGLNVVGSSKAAQARSTGVHYMELHKIACTDVHA